MSVEESEVPYRGGDEAEIPTHSRRGLPGLLAGRPASTDLGSWSPVAAFAVIVLVFSILRPSTYATSANALSILNEQSVLAIMTFGLTVVLLAGEFDLSLGSNFSFAGALAAGLVARDGVTPGLAILVAVLFGVGVGLVNGVLVAYVRVPSLIATLGIATVLDGMTLWYTNGEVIYQNIPHSFVQFGRVSLGSVQLPILYMAFLAFLLWAFLKYTPAGRRLQAVGGNRRAAWLAGVRIRRYTVLAFAICGATAAFAGVLQTSRNAAAHPTQGASLLLPAFAAAFLGSVTLRRGDFHIVGSLIGVYLVAATVNGLFIVGFPFWIQYVFTGLALVIAVAGSRLLTRGAEI